MKDLTVEIPKEYRKQLSRRFSVRYFNHDSFHEGYYNGTPCILCKEYDDCKGCPFGKFETNYSAGCVYWIRKIAGNKFTDKVVFLIRGLKFDKESKDSAKLSLKKLKEGAKKYIKWV